MGSRGIWAFMGARTRRSLTLTWTALFVLSLLLQYFSFAAAPPALAAHDEGLFELDGNAEDAGGTAGDDWDSTNNASDSVFIGFADEQDGVDATYFKGGGSKDVNAISQWEYSANDVAPDKDEILDAYAAAYDKDGDTFVYFGLDKRDADGDNNVGFWFFQDEVSLGANGQFNGEHVVGDILVVSEFSNGGGVSTINIYEWNGSGLTLVASGVQCDVPGDHEACATVNENTENAPWTFLDKSGSTDFLPAEFFEGGINLDLVFGDDVPCFSSFLAETRSSTSTSAQLKDFALGSFNTCVPPDLTTQVSSSVVDFGGTVSDTATLAGTDGPASGTVTFFVCTPAQVTAAGCPEGVGAQVGTPVAVTTSANGGTATSANYTVGLTAAAAGKYCWRAVYTPDDASQYLGASHSNTTSECFTVNPATIDITKTAVPAGPVNAGDAIGFDITVTNTGTGTALNVAVNDPLPAGIVWTAGAVTGPNAPGVTCSIDTVPNPDVLSCTDASLPAGGSWSVHISGTTDAADCGTISNTAFVTTTNDGSDQATATVVVNCPDVKVTKTPDGGTVDAGGQIVWTIRVENIGAGLAKAVVLTDTLPTGITWSEGETDCTLTAGSPQVLTCNVGDLLPGPANAKTYQVTGTTDAADCGLVNNTATATATNEPSNVLVNNSDSGSVTVQCAEIEIVKDANPVGPVSAGDEIGFDITVTNNGDGAATGVHVSDNLPDGITWTADPPTGDTDGVTCGIVGNDLVCDDPSMAAGDSFTVHVHGLTDAADCGTVNNTATVTTTNDGEGSDPASVVVNCPDIGVEKSGNGPIDGGDDAVFTITLTNHGPGDAYDVTLTDQLPDGTWILGGADAGDCEIDGSNLLTCDFGTVTFADNIRTITLTRTTTADDCGVILNEVSVGASNEPENDQFPNSDDASITVNCPDIAVDKEPDLTPISAGEGASFTIVVTNVGTGTAEGVTLSDQLDGSGWVLGGADAGDCSISAGSLLTCNFGDIAEDGSRTFTVSRETTFDDCGDLPNLVAVSATNELEDFLENNIDDATIEVNCPDLGIVKTADHEEAVLAGEEIGFTITVANNGDGTAFNVHVDDTLPAGFSWSIESQDQDPDAPAINDFVLTGNELTFDGNLPAGATISVHVVSGTDGEDCGLVPNTAFLSQTVGESTNPVDDDSAAEAVRCPELTIDKSAAALGQTIDPETGSPFVSIGMTVNYTLEYTLVDGPVTNGTIVDVVPFGLGYVDESATDNEEFTFQSAVINGDGTTTLTWTADDVTAGAPPNTALHYDVTVLAVTELLDNPFVNVVTISSDQTPPDDDDQPINVLTPQINQFTPAGICIGNIPHLQYSFETVNFPLGDLTITFVNPGGTDVVFDDLPAGVVTATGVLYEGSVLWPGAVLDGDGNIVDWPGWTLNADGTWTEGDEFSWVRPSVDVTFAINPEVTLEVAYPAESTECADPPPDLGIVKTNDAPVTTIPTTEGPVDLPTANEGDTVTYTLTYNTNGIPQTNGVLTDVLPEGVTYVEDSASDNDEFTFVSYDDATRTLRWEAEDVTEGGTLTYDVTIDEGAAELDQPLINVATIVTDQQSPDDDDSPVFVPPIPLELTPPPTDALAPSATAGNPGFALMLILLAVAGLALTIGFITPVPESVRRRDRLG